MQCYSTDEQHQSSFRGLLRSQLQPSVDLLVLSTSGSTPRYLGTTAVFTPAKPQPHYYGKAFKFDSTL